MKPTNRFRIISGLKKSAYLKKLLLSFLLTGVVIFSAFSYVVAMIINRSYNNNLAKVNMKAAAQASSTSSTVLTNLFNFYEREFTGDSDLTMLMYADGYDSESSIRAGNVMKKLTSVSSLVKSCYIINFKGNYVCTNLDTFKSTNDFYDKDILDLLRREGSDYNAVFLPRFVPASAFPRRDGEFLLTMIYRSSTDGALVVNIDQSAYLDMVNQSEQAPDIETVILNSYGRVVTATEENSSAFHKKIAFGENWEANSLYRKIRERDGDSGCFTMDIGNRRQMVTYLKNDSQNFTYITLTPSQVLNKNNVPLIQTAVCATAFIVISILLSFVMCWLLYEPVRKLKNDVAGLGTDTAVKPSDDFLYLSRSFHDMQQKCSRLQRSENLYCKVQKEKWLRELLLTGSLSSELTISGMEKMDIALNGPCYLVCVFEIAREEASDYGRKDDMRMFRYALMNISCELVGKLFAYEAVELSGAGTAIVVNMERGDGHAVDGAVSDAAAAMKKYFDVSVFCGVSSVASDVEELGKSCEEAKEALFYRPDENAAAQHFSDLSFLPAEKQSYPMELEHEITDSLKNLQENRLAENMDLFFRRISGCGVDRLRLYALQLKAEIEKTEMRCGVRAADLQQFERLEASASTVSGLKNGFAGHCRQFMAFYAEMKANSDVRAALVNQVRDLVERDLGDENLSVKGLAKEVHLSVNYLRSIFKESSGESLSTYITRKKVERICGLLTDTDLSIQEINDQLGFTTRNYFHVFFKKHTGMTPDQYRRAGKGQ